MRIGLLRHFPVDHKLPSGWKTASDLHVWRQEYDTAQTLAGEFDLGGVVWQACLASDLPRAGITARTVYQGEISQTDLLREAQFALFRTGSLRLPVWVWQWLLRLAWITGHRSQRGCRDEFLRRVLAVAERLSAVNQDTLVVSHAGTMVYLSKELLRRGFAGPKLRLAKHATVYIYERSG